MLRKMLGAYFIIQRRIQSNTVKLNFKIFFDIVARKSLAVEFLGHRARLVHSSRPIRIARKGLRHRLPSLTLEILSSQPLLSIASLLGPLNFSRHFVVRRI